MLLKHFILVAIFLSLFYSCHERVGNPNRDLTVNSYELLDSADFRLDIDEIRRHIIRLGRNDGKLFAADKQVYKYYKQQKDFIWISRLGVNDSGVDTLLSFLHRADSLGISKSFFRLKQIKADLRAVRSLAFDKEHDINKVYARLEYNLTKAYWRYACGMNFGFINPNAFFNSLHVKDSDSIGVSYYQQADLKIYRPDSAFYAKSLESVTHNSVGRFLSSVQPSGKLYSLLIAKLNSGNLTHRMRKKLICNIERCRWRYKQSAGKPIEAEDTYVLVNIPSCSLRAVDNDKVLTMKVGCGTVDNPTPLLSSYIYKMDINPQWIVPKSIAKKIVYSTSYLSRMNMFVFDKEKGKLPVYAISYAKIMSGEQYLIQPGGPANSLGRIIFRFLNNFSVYLHDTSSPWIFKRQVRTVSHGCVRVEKPYELALFLLGNKATSELKDKLDYSVHTDPSPKDSIKRAKIDHKRLINTVKVVPQVPVYIAYFTLYYDEEDAIREFDDVYAFDEAMARILCPSL